jgi:hypothetical protein
LHTPSASKADVLAFLRTFHDKLGVYSVIYEHRPKNTQLLLDLGLTPDARTQHLKTLTTAQYSHGPLAPADPLNSPLWVFGIQLNGQEIYIKITIGRPGKPVICISFHVAEHPLTYPYR